MIHPHESKCTFSTGKKMATGGCAKYAGGDLAKALGRIKAKMYVIAFGQDFAAINGTFAVLLNE